MKALAPSFVVPILDSSIIEMFYGNNNNRQTYLPTNLPTDKPFYRRTKPPTNQSTDEPTCRRSYLPMDYVSTHIRPKSKCVLDVQSFRGLSRKDDVHVLYDLFLGVHVDLGSYYRSLQTIRDKFGTQISSIPPRRARRKMTDLVELYVTMVKLRWWILT